jgi:predicted nuclease of predicted toxin-antitoxin system
MKLLLDENLPKRLKSDLMNHEVYTSAEMNWAGVTNGKLLELLVANSFDALLTFDKNLQYQQNFKRYSISVLVLTASDRYQTLKPLMEKVKQLLVGDLSPGPIEVNSQ